MKNIKSILALIMAVCLMMCLAVPAFATEATTTATTAETTGESVDPTADSAVTPEAGDIDIPLDDEGKAETDGHDHDHEQEDAGSTETTGSEEKPMSVLQIVLIVIEALVSIALIAVVLVQSGKESGLSGALSGNSDSYLSKSGKSMDKTLAKATKWVALAWLVVTLVLVLLY